MMAINLPQEIFYQIALYLPSIRDVLAFSLTNSRMRETLLTPALFKNRLALRWDMSAWKDDDDYNAAVIQSPPSYLERWMRIEYIYGRVVELFDEATVDKYFSKSPSGINVGGETQRPESERLVPGSHHDVVTPQLPDQDPVPPRPTLDEQKAILWLRKLSKVLPVFLTHHRGRNVSKIAEARYRRVVLTFAKVLSSICGALNPKEMFARASGIQALKPKLAMSEYAWFERISFSLTALLIQCDTDTATSIFSDTVAYTDPPSSAFRSFLTTGDLQGHATDMDPYTLIITQSTQHCISERYLSTFLIQATIFMTLCSDTSLPLRAPWIPYINPAASSSYNNLTNLTNSPDGIDPSFLFLPPTRPWLESRLAGTSLTKLLSSADSESNAGDGGHGRLLWAGYYTIDDEAGVDPPMFLELFSLQDPNALPPNAVPDPFKPMHFRGEGHDVIGPFTLEGVCEYISGAVRATKSYATHEWKWQGTVTPFGMAGIWYDHFVARSGWWWIWPKEWSNDPATTGAD